MTVKLAFEIDEQTGARLLVKAIEKEPIKAYVPQWSWLPIEIAMRILPLTLFNKLS